MGGKSEQQVGWDLSKEEPVIPSSFLVYQHIQELKGKPNGKFTQTGVTMYDEKEDINKRKEEKLNDLLDKTCERFEEVKNFVKKGEGIKKHLFVVWKGIKVESNVPCEFFKGFLSDPVFGYIPEDEKGRNKSDSLVLIKMFPKKKLFVEYNLEDGSHTKQISDLLDSKGREIPLIIKKRKLKCQDLYKRSVSDFRNLLAERWDSSRKS